MKQNIHIHTCPACGHKQAEKLVAGMIEQRQKAARALANHLVFSLNIPSTRHLVFILGQGGERNNYDAIAHWVLGKIQHLTQWPLPADEVHNLISELEGELGSILTDLEHGRFYV